MDATQVIETAGGIYGAIQALANVLMTVFPKNTVAFKVCKWLVSGVSRV